MPTKDFGHDTAWRIHKKDERDFRRAHPYILSLPDQLVLEGVMLLLLFGVVPLDGAPLSPPPRGPP
jgi:hypothetical protein